jgi:hypothetical protein
VHQLWQQPNSRNTLQTPPPSAHLHCCDVASLAPGQSTWPKAAQPQIDDRLAARAGQCDQQQLAWTASGLSRSERKKKHFFFPGKKMHLRFCVAIKKGF